MIENHCKGASSGSDEEKVVMRRGYNPKIKQRFSKPIIPGAWRLFESVQELVKLANMVKEVFVDEARGCVM